MTINHSGEGVDPSENSAAAKMIGSSNAEASAWLGSVVANSFDAILSKTLDGIITSWNDGARALFGYDAEEVIGGSVTMLIPDDRLHEEDEILAKLRAGERVAHFETVRRAKDGRELLVELTISPVLDPTGTVIGASKIARDISGRRQLAEQQSLVLREMNHRIKNILSIVQGLIGVCLKTAGSADELAEDLRGRLIALDAAHGLILPNDGHFGTKSSATLKDVVEAVMAPYVATTVRTDIVDAQVGSHALTSLALILHELATNAVKYGALSARNGELTINSEMMAQEINLIWSESGVTPPKDAPEGFGTALQRAALRGLGATMERQWTNDGLEIRLSIPLDVLKR